MKKNNALSGIFISLSPDEDALLKAYCQECDIEYNPKGIKEILFSAVEDREGESVDRDGDDSLSRIIEQTRQFIRDNPQTVKTASSFISRILKK